MYDHHSRCPHVVKIGGGVIGPKAGWGYFRQQTTCARADRCLTSAPPSFFSASRLSPLPWLTPTPPGTEHYARCFFFKSVHPWRCHHTKWNLTSSLGHTMVPEQCFNFRLV